jgi:hypothetical protein
VLRSFDIPISTLASATPKSPGLVPRLLYHPSPSKIVGPSCLSQNSHSPSYSSHNHIAQSAGAGTADQYEHTTQIPPNPPRAHYSHSIPVSRCEVHRSSAKHDHTIPFSCTEYGQRCQFSQLEVDMWHSTLHSDRKSDPRTGICKQASPPSCAVPHLTTPSGDLRLR